jgi:hypothetical protein
LPPMARAKASKSSLSSLYNVSPIRNSTGASCSPPVVYENVSVSGAPVPALARNCIVIFAATASLTCHVWVFAAGHSIERSAVHTHPVRMAPHGNSSKPPSRCAGRRRRGPHRLFPWRCAVATGCAVAAGMTNTHIQPGCHWLSTRDAYARAASLHSLPRRRRTARARTVCTLSRGGVPIGNNPSAGF